MLAFYADESGSFSVSDPGQPWVVLLAIGFDDDHWATIDEALNSLKRSFFPGRLPHEVEIASNDLRMALVRPDAENVFSSLDPLALHRFGEELYGIIEKLPLAWCASVVHKPTASQAHSLSGSDDLHAFAYARLLGTLDRWCGVANEPGRLFMDQRSSTLHGKVHDRIVRVHEHLRDATSRPGRPHVVERPYFHDSARSNHIQIADILAYNVLRRYRNDDPRYPYFKRIQPKMWRSDAASERPDGLVLVEAASQNDETG